MEHRHLLPEEIDLLLDGEVGFGVQPLRAHVRGCDLCRRELEDARALVRERYSGRSRAIARSIAFPSSFDSSSSSAVSPRASTSNEVASVSAADRACGDPSMLIVSTCRLRM